MRESIHRDFDTILEGTMMRLKMFPLLILFPILVIGGCDSGKNRAPGRGSGMGAAKVPVDVVVIQPQLLNNKIFTTGTLLANEEVELRPEVSGRVTGISFAEGSRVKKGEVLLRINDRELKAELKRKEFEEKEASDKEARMLRLVELKGISQEEYDKAANALGMISAEKEVIRSKLAKTEIVAPFDGMVGLRYVSEGSYVTSNMLVATMQDVDPIKVEFSVPEKYAKQIKQGNEITVRVGDSQEEYQGSVYAVEAKIDPATRTMKARAKIANPHGDLIPGSFAKVDITLEQLPNAIVIPTESVIPEMSGEKVFICVDGKVRSVAVKTGIRTETGVQIVEGLNPQDTLVVTGLLQLTDDKAVQIKNLQSD
ncbi:MAG: efflux RND transporter periplasmic adaptor subunit [Candidatus Zixiibacteriota bacterium]